MILIEFLCLKIDKLETTMKYDFYKFKTSFDLKTICQVCDGLLNQSGGEETCVYHVIE